MVDYATEQYLQSRIKRAEEREPITLENNLRFFGQFNEDKLRLVKAIYNYVVEKVNWQGGKYVVPDGLSDAETKEGLAKKLTEFQAAVDNLDSK